MFLEQQFRECVVKRTLPGLYGDIYFLEGGLVCQKPSTPHEYLVRLRLWEKIFGFGPWALGIQDSGQIVSIQTFVQGDIPDQSDVNNSFARAGLTPFARIAGCGRRMMKRARFPSGWGDARADNFVSHEGDIIPIDLRMWITRR